MRSLEDQKAMMATAAEEAAAVATADLEAEKKAAAEALQLAEKQSEAKVDEINAQITKAEVHQLHNC